MPLAAIELGDRLRIAHAWPPASATHAAVTAPMHIAQGHHDAAPVAAAPVSRRYARRARARPSGCAGGVSDIRTPLRTSPIVPTRGCGTSCRMPRCFDLRILEHLVEIVLSAAAGTSSACSFASQASRVSWLNTAASSSLQRIVVAAAARLLAGEARIVEPFRPAGDAGERLPEFVRRRQMDHERLAVAGDERIDLRRVRAGGAVRHLAVLEKARGILAAERNRGLQQRGVDALPLAGAIARDLQRAEDAVARHHAGEMVRERDAHRTRAHR